ncbi:hypothetical protein [Haladaptatus caseinilyticus]|uniref:hypothetical protein n=1 Tax=Haladaptatus caseinilyticus TaxID=2993314 RepID=UPI00224A66E5|nr:hypothetical protein [Haladaptatus caseinilyticus]
MSKNNGSESKLKRRGYLKGMVAAGIGLGTAFSASSSAESYTDADGDSVYLVFGADTSESDLESWLQDRMGDIQSSSQESSSEVVQYQDVDQLNVNQQENAVAIAINGGEADAIQRTYQYNTNTQEGNAQSINIQKEDKKHSFKNMEHVYIVFADEGGSREFSGWVVADDTYESEQTAEAEIDQEQEVEQLNYNSQSTAVAIAEGGSYSRSFQRSYQKNANVQHAEAVAANIGDGDDQSADSSVEQSQEVDQVNVNEQGIAVAIAVGDGSVAKAWQVSCQYNVNRQIADATAINFEPNSIAEVSANASMQGDFSKSDVKRADNGEGQSNTQGASASIDQFQDVSQQNINLQNAAVSVALDYSDATATQASYQANFNAQIAEAVAVNINEGAEKATAVLNGMDANGDGSWAVSYDKGGKQVSEQTAIANIVQEQYVEQLNVNEQYSAIAYAEDDGSATAEQLNYQVNQNAQVAESEASNENEQCAA